MVSLFAVAALSLTAGLRQTAPHPEDVKSLDAVIGALYDVISGQPGAKHDWDRFRSLFTQDARMEAVVGTKDSPMRVFSFTPGDYVKLSGPVIERDGFHEKEIARKVEQFGRMAHVYSTYRSQILSGTLKGTQRGINSIELFNDGARWWVVNIYWQDEDAKNQIPKEYLSGRNKL